MSPPPTQNNNLIPLKITLSTTSSTSNSHLGKATMNVTLTNTSPASTLHLLRWQTPLDPKSVALGIFKFKSATTGQLARCLDLKLNRKLPEEGYFKVGNEDVVTLKPGEEVGREVVAGEPEVALEKGVKYEVWAEGWWMGVWVERGEREGEGKLALDGDERLARGEFRSEAITQQVPKDE